MVGGARELHGRAAPRLSLGSGPAAEAPYLVDSRVLTWFAIRTRFAWEPLVAREIRTLGTDFRSYCPMLRIWWRDRFHRKQETLRPLWATYVLADWPLTDETWHAVMDITGVSGIIGGARPMPIDEKEISELVARTDETGVVQGIEDLIERLRLGFGRGDQIRIEGGGLDGVTGICNWTDAHGANVKIMLLGREVSTYIAHSSARIIRIEAENGSVGSRSKARRERRRVMTEKRGIDSA
jgi:transcription antitermination factor NusG